MKREILFRGKRVATATFVCGFYLVFDNRNHSIVNDNGNFWVIPETVGQFTGKTDKNGKKVFEHDILQTFTVWADGTVEKCGVGIVQWCENDQCYVLATKEGYHIDDFGNLGRPEYYEVIGNIHDHPEFLEGGVEGCG